MTKTSPANKMSLGSHGIVCGGGGGGGGGEREGDSLSPPPPYPRPSTPTQRSPRVLSRRLTIRQLSIYGCELVINRFGGSRIHFQPAI